jgi:hypothetical protein
VPPGLVQKLMDAEAWLGYGVTGVGVRVELARALEMLTRS